jgi:PadR family transcriptional regulator PadR
MQSMEGKSPPLMAGVPELMILRLLSEREMYGYELARAIRVLSKETLNIGEGVLYPALHALEARQLLRSRSALVDGRTRVYYTLSARGAKRLARLTEEWRRISAGVDSVLGDPDHG